MNIGSQLAMPPLDWNPSRPSPQPHWKIATSAPYAAATESRLSRIAFDRDHDRAEGHQQEPEGEEQDEAEDQRNRLGLGGVEVLRIRRHAGHGVLDAVDLAHGLRQQVVPQGVERMVGAAVDAVPGERDVDPGDRARRGSPRR